MSDCPKLKESLFCEMGQWVMNQVFSQVTIEHWKKEWSRLSVTIVSMGKVWFEMFSIYSL